GVALVINHHPRLAWKLAFAVASGFLAAQAYGVLWKGMTHCGCFGLLLRLTPIQSMLIDVGILATSVCGARYWSRGIHADFVQRATEQERSRQAAVDLLCLASIALTVFAI